MSISVIWRSRKTKIWRTVKGGKPAKAISQDVHHVRYIDVIEGRANGRENEAQITYSERGNIQGAQFYAVAAAVFEAARTQGLGKPLPDEWFLQDIRD